MKKIILLIPVLIIMLACNNEESPIKLKVNATNNTEEKLSLMEADRQFSEMSDKQGMKTAFLAFADENGILLRPNRMPVKGKPALDQYFGNDPEQVKLVWEPLDADVAKAADMGYTYGTYKVKNLAADSILSEGTYVSIWKKDASGNWKYVLDSGNEGLQPKISQ